jgi:uncharacterized protein
MSPRLRLDTAAARAVACAAQGLDRPPARAARTADVLAAIRRIRALQIDTIHVVARSPYFVLWSRIGDYEPRWLDDLLADGRIFEYWAHEACFLPIEDYALFRHRMIDPGDWGWKYSAAWLRDNRATVQRVLERIRTEGALRSADFEAPPRDGRWWGWKPDKRALEMLLTAGHLMIARRERFQRVYDLRERVLPEWRDDALPDARDAARELALRAVQAIGVATAGWVADYFRTARRATTELVRTLAADGELLEAHVDGWQEPAYVHPANAALAQDAAAGRCRPRLTTLLSPFDPLVWDRRRALVTFGFDYRIECYTPAARRRYGYFVLPVLRDGELVARLDAKSHRKEGRFEIRSFYLEPGRKPEDALLYDIARAFLACARWHRTPRVLITRAEPRGTLTRLRAALRAAG